MEIKVHGRTRHSTSSGWTMSDEYRNKQNRCPRMSSEGISQKFGSIASEYNPPSNPILVIFNSWIGSFTQKSRGKTDLCFFESDSKYLDSNIDRPYSFSAPAVRAPRQRHIRDLWEFFPRHRGRLSRIWAWHNQIYFRLMRG